MAYALVAYFLKYRYIDLTSAGGAPGAAALQPSWTVTMPADSMSDAEISGLADRLLAAPWLGALPPLHVRGAVSWLLRLGLLQVGPDSAASAPGSPTTGASVLRICENLNFSDPDVHSRYSHALGTARLGEARRGRVLVDAGSALTAVGAVATHNLFVTAGVNDTIRIATYHLRTVVAGREVVQWLTDKPNLRVDIMCLGPTAVEGLAEGADPESLVASLAGGIQDFEHLLKELPRQQRRRVRLRVYGDREEDAQFRGAILCGARGEGLTPKRVVATVWPYGEFRANYGKLVVLEGNSNLARMLTDYYERAWLNAVPLTLGRPRESVTWALRSLTIELVGTVIVASVAGGAFLVHPQVGSEPFFVVVGTLPVLLVTARTVLGQLRRALGLRRAIARHRRTFSAEGSSA